jgi:molybdopterin-guanine dinucleotide biosynthesis protein A
VAAQISDVVLPRHSDGQLEPLAALYDTQALLEHATTALGSGNRKVTAALSNLRVRYYDIPTELESMFHNVNTAADLAWINPQ